LHKWTGIIKGDFASEAHTIRHDLATEGKFYNPDKSPGTISPGGKIWYGEMGNGLFNFNGGKQQIDSFDEVNPTIDYEFYEWLARNIKSGKYGNKIVKVFTEGGKGSGNGGCYTLKDVDPAEAAQPTTGPQYLAVFNTHDDICLENNKGNGRQFGPSVLAPFSKVDLRAAYIDGVFISKEFTCFDGSIQLHGEGYNGPIECVDEEVSVPPPTMDCDTALANLGLGFSGATGVNAFDNDGCWPMINTPQPNPPFGRDDSVNLFVGGNAEIGYAVEAEGKIVIMGDLNNKGNGWGDVTSVGAGYQVLPNDGANCLVVGGDVSTKKSVRLGPGTWVYQTIQCNMVYGTSRDNSVTDFALNGGQLIPLSQSTEDMNHYEQMKEVLYAKSQYWKNMDANGQIKKDSRYLMFSCPTNKDTHVFNFEPSMLNGMDKISFASSCNDKTLLVNVKGTGKITVKTVEMLPMSNMQRSAECNIAKNLLWNFPDATSVEIGGGGSDEWIGATLVTGDLTHHTSGMSGRVIVLGDLYHDGTSGSEFHAMIYDPPTPLPDPYCEDYSFAQPKPKEPVAPPPTTSATEPIELEPQPTSPPTDAPVPDSGGGGGGGPAYGSGCGVEWNDCKSKGCCDGLYCKVESEWTHQCRIDPSATCLAKGKACTGSAGKAGVCCNGLKCDGNKNYASCKQ
jgi:choice-of-anchor A domain-containing protein